jgi:23S rRNA (uridine2552-2'-O)-methyltransferase
MGRSKSSTRWIHEHINDEFVRLAQKEGYRSRAVYKLKELDEKYHLFRPGQRVVDLGAAPGSWSEYVADKVGDRGRVVALDILPMDFLAGVEFIQGDFQDEIVLASLLKLLGEERADLVISDMAPNMSGMDAVDIPRSMYLVELAHDLVKQVLRRGGSFVCKLFQGEGSDAWLKALRADFGGVVVKKPKASRSRSREVYVLARDFKA